jgi:carbon-monoxide dehydrogenase large subunit
VVYDSADLPAAFDLARQAIEADLPEARTRAEARGRRAGAAVVPFILPTGIGPFETARLVVEPPGTVAVYVGTTSMGQGHRTSLAQVCADATGVPLASIDVREGDPASVPASIGTFASRSLATAGTAVWKAGLQLRAQLTELSGEGPADLSRALERAGGLIEATARFDVPNLTYAYGCHAAQVELDPELGALRVVRYVVVADPGRVVNPDLVRDQVRGAAVLGIGGALLEAIEYSPDGQPLTTTFLDFLLPTATDVPPIEVILVDRARSPLNPLGIKGAGEMGSAACGATIACAAQDALGRTVRWLDALPLTPDRLLATE